MAIKVLLSPPAGGKTSACIGRILAVLREHPLAPIWVVLPDSLQAYAFRQRLANAGGGLGVHAGTFGDLYGEILRKADRAVPLASEWVVHRLLQHCVQHLHEKGDLPYYSPLIRTPGFLRVVRGGIAELKRARVWPDRFMEEASARSQGLLELASIYSNYQQTLNTLGWADSEGIHWLATEALEQDPELMSDWPLLIVDGFDSFHESQRAALRLLGNRLEEVILTLPGLPDTGRLALRRVDRVLQKLMEGMPSLQVEILAQETHLTAPFAHLEKHLFEASAEVLDPGDQVTMMEVPSPIEESREALRWIKSKIERENLWISNCSLIVANLERYLPFLKEAANEFGIPLRTLHGEVLTSAPPIAALLDLLELPLRNYPRRLLLEAVRSPYFDLSSCGLSHLDAYRLEAVSQHGQVIEGMDQWRDTLERLAQIETFPEDYDGEATRIELPIGESASQLLEGLKAFADRLTMTDARSMAEWVRWLEDLIDVFHFLEQREETRDEAAFLNLREILRSFVLGEAISGEGEIDAQRFFAMLRDILAASLYQENPKWTEPALWVLSPHGARGLRFDAVAVLGLAEGIFPEVEREDPFLPEEIRTTLDLEPRLMREQAGLFYQVVSRADRCLLLTRPYLAEDGEIWEASPYWNAIAKLLRANPIKMQSETPRPLADAASSQELLFWAVRRKGLPKQYSEDLMERWRCLQRSRDVLEARQSKEPTGPFEGILQDLAPLMQDRFGADHVWSPSRLETYGTCPLRFFVETAMALEPKIPPEPGFDALQLGTMLHQILEEAYRSAKDSTSTEDLLEVLEPLAREAFADAPESLGFRPSALWEVEQEQLLAALKETVLGLAEASKDWRPHALERAFGVEGEPPLELELEESPVLLRGIIDRVDIDDAGNLRVLDYKTGSSHLDRRDLVEGRRLQLPLYALAAKEALKLGDPIEGFYWAIRKAEAGRLKLSKFYSKAEDRDYSGLEGAIELACEHVFRIVKGIGSGEFPPIPPRGGCPSYCAAASWCWRYRSSEW